MSRFRFWLGESHLVYQIMIFLLLAAVVVGGSLIIQVLTGSAPQCDGC